MERPSGIRDMQTFRKLPKTSPKRKTKVGITIRLCHTPASRSTRGAFLRVACLTATPLPHEPAPRFGNLARFRYTKNMAMSSYEHWIRRYEHRRWTADDNRMVRPFDWGLEHIGGTLSDSADP